MSALVQRTCTQNGVLPKKWKNTSQTKGIAAVATRVNVAVLANHYLIIPHSHFVTFLILLVLPKDHVVINLGATYGKGIDKNL